MLSSNFNPWNVSKIYDYSKLIQEFGISSFDSLISKIKFPNRYMTRQIIFGHRNFNAIIDDINNNLPYSVLDGFMPTGCSHLGHKLVMDQIVWFQKNGGEVFISIADMEAHSVRGISWAKCFEIGINEYILSLISLGLKPDKTHFYFQSKCNHIQKLTFELGMNVNFNDLKSIYGFTENIHLSHMISTINQASDILLPQLTDFCGPSHVVIPVGSDQDPHIRLTRDLVNKINLFIIEKRKIVDTFYWSIRSKNAPKDLFLVLEKKLDKLNIKNKKVSKMHIDVFEKISYNKLQNIVNEIAFENNLYNFYEPSSTYHKFMSGLNGGKMSSSIPESHISLTESFESLNIKIKKAKTGGKQTSKEQQIFGGNPDSCSIYELFLYHLYPDDNDINELYSDCVNGKILCGHCKSIAIEKLNKFLIEHKEKKNLAMDNLDMFDFLY